MSYGKEEFLKVKKQYDLYLKEYNNLQHTNIDQNYIRNFRHSSRNSYYRENHRYPDKYAEIARTCNIGIQTTKRIISILESGYDELIDQCCNGLHTINNAYKNFQRLNKLKESSLNTIDLDAIDESKIIRKFLNTSLNRWQNRGFLDGYKYKADVDGFEINFDNVNMINHFLNKFLRHMYESEGLTFPEHEVNLKELIENHTNS